MTQHTHPRRLRLALLLCAAPWSLAASGDTPITVKDGGSLVLIANGLDAGGQWKTSGSEVRHRNIQGVLTGVKISENGADRCNGDAKCGIDPAKPWAIRVTYNLRTVTISSISANKGLHLRFSPKIPFTRWDKTENMDERVFGHGDGHHIDSIKINGSDTTLCAGNGGCEVTVTYAVP